MIYVFLRKIARKSYYFTVCHHHPDYA